MKHCNKLIALSLAMLLLCTLLAGCGGSPAPSASAGSASAGSGAAPAKEYNGNDISEPVELTMYVIGDKPADADAVLAKINEKAQADLNVTLTMNYISLSDYEQKYPLLMTSGEKFDLIYTSTWAFYTQEATKGAFAEVTPEILEKYMPLTNDGQSKMAFEQAKIDGKAYFVPKNSPYINNAVPVLIRGDLRKKYGMDEINSIEALEKYFDAVVENEEGVYPYAASQNNVEMAMNLFSANNNFLPISGLDKFYGYQYETGKTPTVDDMKWQFETPEYLAYLKQMKAWADKGYWSKNAIANSISPRDAFENGTSASLFWNYDTCAATAISVQQAHPDWEPELVNITPGVVHAAGMYIGDGVAVFSQSANQERAFMLLDKMKFDKEYYDLERYGIEGEHWTATGENTWQPGDKQNAFTMGNATSWGLKNDACERIQGDAGATQSDVYKSLFDDAITEVASGFVFNDANVKNELAALNETRTRYIYLLELGLVEDVEATLAEFQETCKAAGLEKVDAEFRSQFDAYLKALK